MATKEEKPKVIERQGHTDGHTDLAVTSDGKYGGNIVTPRSCRTYADEHAVKRSLLPGPNRKWITGGEDEVVHSFDANDISAEGGTLESNHAARIKSVASKVSPHTRLSGQDSVSLLTLSLLSRRCCATSQGRWIAAGDHDGKVLLYSYPKNDFVTILLRSPLEISQVVFDSTATHVAIASLYGHRHSVDSEALFPSLTPWLARLALLGFYRDNQVSVVSVEDPTKIQVFRHKGRLRSVAVDPLGQFLVRAATCNTKAVGGDPET